MAVSELHRRLEHLVTYSSQLIFVSGDTIAEQQRSLQTFLGQQNDNTEVAYINAEPGNTAQQYRQQIHQQLLGHQEGLIQRPLNELLAPLNHHDGPVLICICQAEYLDQSFLQELWELVLQSRFAGNRQHLNVLLFGRPEWASEAKNWLPARNRNKPVLLSTESFESAVHSPTELEQLIATKREAFAMRLQQRAEQQALPARQSPLHTWWFRSVVGLMFIATFAGMLLWQYAEQVPQIWHQLYSETNQPPEPIVDETTVDTSIVADESPFEILTSAPVAADAQGNGDALVANWDAQVALMREKIRGTEQALPEVQDPISLQSDSPEPDEPTIFPQEAEVLDYPIEDIVSVEQLPPQVSAPANMPSETAVSVSSELATSPPDINDPLSVDVVKAVEIENRDPLTLLSPADYVIQVAGLRSERLMEDFIDDNGLRDKVWVYKTRKFGGDWFVLLYNQSYPDIQEAREQMGALSSVLQRGTPFIKSVRVVEQERAQ